MSSPERHSVRETRFVVGIDLGTTNTAVSYVDLESETRAVEQFAITQLIDAGEVGAPELLPSFCYLPGPHELPGGALELPWDADLEYAVGVFARERGGAVPGRLIGSAKSWLAHAGVDRTKGILPWHGDLGDDALSPVQVSRYYLGHIRAAWDSRFGAKRDCNGTPCVLSEQQVILTVPASFDEAARELTVAAARDAGLDNLVLIEEPLAAFYSWLWQHETTWQDGLTEGETVLVVDVGGGTTDFSLIRIENDYTLRRTAVGDHLLLGGDNMDMALARQVEATWNTRLAPKEWSLLCQECRRAKERLLADDAPESVKIGIAGAGSSIVAGTRTHVLERSTVVAAIRDGFFPAVSTDTAPPTKGSGIRAMGLPYASDAAVTRHLLQFLRLATGTVHGEPNEFVQPSHILFNGGALLPRVLRQRIAGVVGQWCGLQAPVAELEARDLNLAVSRGAAYYGLVRLGSGVRVKGGIARAYYLEVGTGAESQLVCVMPRDTEEGIPLQLQDQAFRLVTNQPVRFPLFCSATRLGDRLGQVLTDRDEISELPPLQTVLTYGRKSQDELDVCLASMLNEIGTLDIWCATPDDQHRYPLSFDLRAPAGNSVPETGGVTVEQERIEAGVLALRRAFRDGDRLPQVNRDLEDAVGVQRAEWGLLLLRTLADELIKHPDMRTVTPRHEARWLNLVGYCLRPGFGAAGDEWRMRELWKVWHAGPLSGRNPQVAAEWWVCWRRVAGGLRAGHQQHIGSGLLKELVPKSVERLGPRKRGVQEAAEMWRCLGAMERLSPKAKAQVIRAVLRPKQKLEPYHLWVVARLGARVLMYGPENGLIPAAKLEPLLTGLLQRAGRGKPQRMALFAVASLCRLCGLREFDIDDRIRGKARGLLQGTEAPEEWVAQLDAVRASSRAYESEAMGDALPLGLSMGERRTSSTKQH